LILEKNKQDFGRAQAEEDVPEPFNALNRLVKIDPLNWYWYHERAKLLLKIRERDEAENDFKRALLVEPNW
jgi:Flp pilus assembly protein TadD